MAPFEALYGRKCRTPISWDDVGERRLLGPDIIQQIVDKIQLIRQWLQTAQSRHKSYADHKRRDLSFQLGDHVFLKVSLTKDMMRFGVRGKLSLRFVGPFKVLEKIGEVAYHLALLPSLTGVHNILHISILRKYVPNSDHVVEFGRL